MRTPGKIFGGHVCNLDGTVRLGETLAVPKDIAASAKLYPGGLGKLLRRASRPEAHSEKERGD